MVITKHLVQMDRLNNAEEIAAVIKEALVNQPTTEELTGSRFFVRTDGEQPLLLVNIGPVRYVYYVPTVDLAIEQLNLVAGPHWRAIGR